MLGYVDLTQDESAELSAALLDPSLRSDSEGDTLPIREIVRKRILRLPQIARRVKNAGVSDPEDDDLSSDYYSDDPIDHISPTPMGYQPFLH